MLRRRCVILAKEEATYGTDSVPTAAANAILAFDPEIKPIGERLERRPVLTTLSPYPHIIGSRYRDITFKTELRGSGSLGVATKEGDLFEACGMLETIVAITSVKYTPASSSLKSCTIYAYIDGLLWKLLGCVGTWEIVTEAGKPAMISWTFRGLYSAPTDTALPGSVTFDTPIPPVAVSSGFKLNAITTLVAQSVQVNIGNAIAQRDDVNSADGIKGFQISGRAGSGSFNPEAVSVATYPFESDWKSAAQRALEITLGSAGGNRIKVSGPKVQIDAPTPGDRNEILIFSTPFFLEMNAGDDEVEIFID